MSFKYEYFVRWSDLDPNNHVRHSVYYDYAAQARIQALAELGLTMSFFAKHEMGPILFSEAAQFRKELRAGEKISVEVSVQFLSEDYRKFEMVHKICNAKGELSADVEVKGAWMDLVARKVKVPPKELIEALKKF